MHPLKLAYIGMLLLPAACAATPVNQNAKACEPLLVADCMTLLQKKGLSAESIDNALASVAETRLVHNKPEPAIEYLEVLVKRDDKSAFTYRKLGDAFSMLARQDQTVVDSVNDLLSGTNYMIASLNYMMAATRDPGDQANYIDATKTAVLAGACEVAESTRQMHEKHFGQNDHQRELATLVRQKCG